ncbi:MAG: cyclic nucleotide-binding domain-containing protein, partial [Spirochaetota bacterium]
MKPDSTLSIVNYQAGSYIIVENQPNSQQKQGVFFIIRSGKVRVENLVDQMLGLQSHELSPGGFFGVISAMSAQGSNETAVALTDCSMIMVKSTKFGDLVLEAPSIALKIIRALSNDLRHYDNELALRMVDKNYSADNSLNLFHMGEFFYNAKSFNHAAYIFASYIESHPDGEKKQEAQDYLDKMGLTVEPPSGFSRTYQDEEMICAEYMPGSELYIIQSGKVKITKVINEQEMILAILDAGEIVGEMSLLNNKERTANIIAYGETK